MGKWHCAWNVLVRGELRNYSHAALKWRRGVPQSRGDCHEAMLRASSRAVTPPPPRCIDRPGPHRVHSIQSWHPLLHTAHCHLPTAHTVGTIPVGHAQSRVSLKSRTPRPGTSDLGHYRLTPDLLKAEPMRPGQQGSAGRQSPSSARKASGDLVQL